MGREAHMGYTLTSTANVASVWYFNDNIKPYQYISGFNIAQIYQVATASQ